MTGRILICIYLMCYAQFAAALYSWDRDKHTGNARLLLRGFAVLSEQPAGQASSAERRQESFGGLARLLIDSEYQGRWRYEINGYQTYISNTIARESGITATGQDVERSGALEWSLSDSEYAHFAFDRLNIAWSSDKIDARFGRQPVNLSTTFFFSPNDFFAPFVAQSFYRVYKPGVDALRSSVSIGELSSLGLIAVQGYRPSASSETGWSDEPELARNSYLLHYVTNLAGFEWALLAGKVRRSRIKGGSISGELFGWLGVRIEAHHAQELDGGQQGFSKYSIGLEHRWENSLYLQLEQYYHGPGATDVKQYVYTSAYPARRYQALGLSYEFSPLLTGQMSIIRNQVDASRLYSMNAVYSLSNESELSFALSVSDGGRAPAGSPAGQYANYPKLLNLEWRAYF